MNIRKYFVYYIAVFSLALAGAEPAFSMELMSPAGQVGQKKVHAEVYYRQIFKQKLNLDLSSTGRIVVGGSTLPVNSTSELESAGSGNGMMARVSFQPFETPIQYYFLGGAGHYELKIPSGSYSNMHATDNPGYVFGGGIKYTVVPRTVVSPAVSIDLSATHSRYKLGNFVSGDGQTVGNISQVLTIFEIQGAIEASRKFLFDLGDNKAGIEPYGGVKMMRTRTNFDDSSTGGHFSGTRTDVAPFFGFKFTPFPHQGIVVEGSVLSEYSASVGLTLDF